MAAFDDQAFQEFMMEYKELLGDLRPAVIELENEPNRLELVEEPFRILHSIKGMASFFSLNPVKKCAHLLEDLLTEIKEERCLISPQVIDVLLAGADILERLYKKLKSGETEIQLKPKEEKLLEQAVQIKEEEVDIAGFFGQFLEQLKDIATNMMEVSDLADHPLVERLNKELMQAETTFSGDQQEGGAQATGSLFIDKKVIIDEVDISEELTQMESLCRECAESQSEDLEEEKLKKFGENLNSLLKKCDAKNWIDIKEVLLEIKKEFDRFMDTTGFNYILADSALQHLAGLKKQIEAAGGKVGAQSSEASGPQVDKGRPKRRTFRVEENRVDAFMDYVGELIITGEMYKHISRELESSDVENKVINQLKDTNMSFKKLSDNLQESLLEIRRVPIKNLLKKYPAIVRKLAGKMDKKIDVDIEGEDTEVDKSLLETLEVPLTHLIRNAADHGIESMEQREKAGKPPVGEIKIKVDSDKENLTITISDDGQGLDREAIAEKAIEVGLIDAAEIEEMPDEEIDRLIFSSGFSTAEEVTDVSGRGVGMDAVLNKISGVGGSIDVQSTPGEGSKWILEMPRAQMVVVEEGLVVSSGAESFVVPIEIVIESVSLSKLKITRVEGRGEMVKLRDKLFPVYWLGEVLEVDDFDRNSADPVVLIVKAEKKEFALIVDDIREQKKVVVQELGVAFREINYSRGCALMGDGTVSLILDPVGFIKTAGSRSH